MSLEVSPTSRAVCKECKERITKGDVRWFTEQYFKGHNIKLCFHLDCFTPKKKLQKFIPPDNMPKGYGDLPEESRAVVDSWIVKWNTKVNKKVAQEKATFKRIKEEDTSIPTDISPVPTKKRRKGKDESNLFVLPREVFFGILSCNEGVDLFTIAIVCKQWSEWLDEEDSDVWRVACMARITSLTSNTDLRMKKQERTWKSFFKHLLLNCCVYCGEPAEYFALLGELLCHSCRKLPQYETINKTTLKTQYKLNDVDIKKYKLIHHQIGSSKLFLKRDVEAAYNMKYKSYADLDQELDDYLQLKE